MGRRAGSRRGAASVRAAASANCPYQPRTLRPSVVPRREVGPPVNTVRGLITCVRRPSGRGASRTDVRIERPGCMHAAVLESRLRVVRAGTMEHLTPSAHG